MTTVDIVPAEESAPALEALADEPLADELASAPEPLEVPVSDIPDIPEAPPVKPKRAPRAKAAPKPKRAPRTKPAPEPEEEPEPEAPKFAEAVAPSWQRHDDLIPLINQQLHRYMLHQEEMERQRRIEVINSFRIV
jgi:hypothetical protein